MQTQTRTDIRKLAEAFETIADVLHRIADAPPPRQTAEYLNKTEAAKILGCSPATIRNRIAEGALREYAAGIRRDELDAYAASKTRTKKGASHA